MGKLTEQQFYDYKKIKDIKHLINNQQTKQVQNIIRFYDTQSIKSVLRTIHNFILCGVNKNWLSRLYLIKNKIKKDTSSEFACKIRYGDKWGEYYQKHKESCRMNLNKFISLYGEEEGKRRWELRNKRIRSYGLIYSVERYGEEEGKRRWEKTLKQKIATMQERKKEKPYRNGRTLIEYQNRYGVEIGYNKWLERNKKQSVRFSIQYYLNEYGEDEGYRQWLLYTSSMNKTSLVSYILRYGEVLGTEKFNIFSKTMSYIQTLEYYIKKYGNDVGIEKYRETQIKKRFESPCYSKISQELFWEIIKIFGKDECYFYELNQEFVFYVWKFDLGIISVDFKYQNKIIEFDGDYWHSFEKQQLIDKNRDQYLISKDYQVFRVKEGDYRNNKLKIIQNCINFLNE